MTGILLVDKPEGATSAGVIRALKGRLGRAKVGHLGTLDPFASGLLPLCVGEATKVARYLLLEEKGYTGRIRLGSETDTLDRTGEVLERAPVPPLDAAALDRVAARFRGVQRQTPPMYSALKRDGVPLYKLARRGVSVERTPREIRIDVLDLTVGAPDAIDFVLRCTKGTYVRVLAADLGRALGTVAHLESLRRTFVGPFHVDAAWPLDRLQTGPDILPLVGIAEALPGLRRLTLDAPALATLRRGQQTPLRELPTGAAGEVALVLDAAAEVSAVIEVGADGSGWRIVRLLVGD